MLFFFAAFTVVLLVCCWWIGDLAVVTKLVLTAMYGGAWTLFFWKPIAWIPAQCVMIAAVGGATFGMDFLRRRLR